MSHSAPGSNPVAALRHDLRTPVNHIVGYAEMLIEDLEGPANADRRAALESTIEAARDALKLISLVLAPTRDTIEPAEVSGLYHKLEVPQHRILDAIHALLAATGEIPTPTFLDDLHKIEAAAARLVPTTSVTEAKPAAQAAAGNGKARVLVVDDEAGNRDLLSRRLQREGYAVITAAGGREALETVTKEAVDVVLLDVMMPDLDGLAVLERLKAEPLTRDLPVIMISALDDLSAIAHCIEAGALDYLPKPFEPVILRARLAASLAEKRFRDQERDLVKALSVVTAAATAVEAGAYQAGQLGEMAQRPDAVGRLARVMDRMATQVGARESSLRGRLDRLRTEIGHARKTQEVVTHAEEEDRLSAGDLFAGRYRIESVLGRGGMGTVYKARDAELDETVAIKTLRPELVADEESRERFKDEIRLTRRITHRNVVRTHDFGEANGLWYITMEFVEGLTVRQLLDARGTLGVESALAIGSQLAESLGVAHATGVIHRDIKPQNLLLDPEGVLKVMDFGVARLARASAAARHTQAGLIVGTPAYMSPEQLTGEEIDARSDLYSAGVVLFELLTGRLPLDGGTVMALFAKVLSEDPPRPGTMVAGVPPALDELVYQLLAKRPEDRIESATVLLERLHAMA